MQYTIIYKNPSVCLHTWLVWLLKHFRKSVGISFKCHYFFSPMTLLVVIVFLESLGGKLYKKLTVLKVKEGIRLFYKAPVCIILGGKGSKDLFIGRNSFPFHLMLSLPFIKHFSPHLINHGLGFDSWLHCILKLCLDLFKWLLTNSLLVATFTINLQLHNPQICSSSSIAYIFCSNELNCEWNGTCCTALHNKLSRLIFSLPS